MQLNFQSDWFHQNPGAIKAQKRYGCITSTLYMLLVTCFDLRSEPSN